jgi:succinyldiaminopimelate transaminase
MTPTLAELPPHALSAFTADVQAALAGLPLDAEDIIDLGLGDSAEPVAPFIRRALVDAIGERTKYPPVAGLPELRRAAAAWARRRFGADLDPETQIQPTQGSKEAVFALGLELREPGREVVAVTTPGYAIPERGARIAGLEPLLLPVTAENGFRPDLDAIPWDRLAILWLNYPNNPTGALAPAGLYAEAAARCREAGAVLASDEAYTELFWTDEAPGSALELPGLDRVLAFHSLSKRSGLTGYRTGFVAGDPELIALIRKFRAMAGMAPAEFVQRAAVAAWEDEAHVHERRRVIGEKRAALRDALERAGFTLAGSEAGLFLWARVPGDDADGVARRLLARGVVVVPGRYFGPGGEAWIRVAPAPEAARCAEAAERIIDEAKGAGWRS